MVIGSVGNAALAALVLVASALAVSRRDLTISAILCLLALVAMSWGFVHWMVE